MNNLVNVSIYEANHYPHFVTVNFSKKILDSVLIIDLEQYPERIFEHLIKDVIYEYDPSEFEYKPKYFSMVIENMDDSEPFRLQYNFRMTSYDDIKQIIIMRR